MPRMKRGPRRLSAATPVPAILGCQCPRAVLRAFRSAATPSPARTRPRGRNHRLPTPVCARSSVAGSAAEVSPASGAPAEPSPVPSLVDGVLDGEVLGAAESVGVEDAVGAADSVGAVLDAGARAKTSASAPRLAKTVSPL